MPPSVFISYTHDSDEHKKRVLDLAQRLRGDGLDCVVDRFVETNPPEGGWHVWTERQMWDANFVLLVCTPVSLRRWKGEEPEGVGLGASWEWKVVYDILYAQRGENHKFVPVLLEGGGGADVPKILHSRATTYELPRDYDDLLRYLTGQLLVVPAPVGAVPLLPLAAGHRGGRSHTGHGGCGCSQGRWCSRPYPWCTG